MLSSSIARRSSARSIKAGDPIFTLVAAGSIWALAYIDESRAGAIKEGQPAEVRLRSLPHQVFPARVVRIGIESDRVTEERRVYVKCEQCPVRFHLGEQAEVLITVATLPKAQAGARSGGHRLRRHQGHGVERRERAPEAPRRRPSAIARKIRASRSGTGSRKAPRSSPQVSPSLQEGRAARAKRGGQAVNLAYRDVRHNLFRFLLTCFGLSLLLGVVLAMIGIYRGIVVDALTVARNHGVDLWVVEAGSRGPFAEASRIPGDSREAIARLAGVTAAGSVTYQTVEAERLGPQGAGSMSSASSRAGREGPFTSPPAGRSARAISRWSPIAAPDWSSATACRLGPHHLHGRRPDREPGRVRRRSRRLHHPARCPEAAVRPGAAGCPCPAGQRHARARAGTRSTPWWRASRPTANLEAVAEAARRWKHLAALTQAEQERILAESLVDRARRQIGMFTSILLLVSAVIIALIIYTMTMEKLRQIAMLKLIGAPDRTIVGMIVQQALALGLTGFAFGALLIANIKDYFPRRVVLEPDNVLALGGVVVLVCLLASALGVRAALKADPATALGS